MKQNKNLQNAISILIVDVLPIIGGMYILVKINSLT